MKTANKVIAGNLAVYGLMFFLGVYGASMTPEAYETTQGLASISLMVIIGFNIWYLVKHK